MLENLKITKNIHYKYSHFKPKFLTEYDSAVRKFWKILEKLKNRKNSKKLHYPNSNATFSAQHESKVSKFLETFRKARKVKKYIKNCRDTHFNSDFLAKHDSAILRWTRFRGQKILRNSGQAGKSKKYKNWHNTHFNVIFFAEHESEVRKFWKHLKKPEN